MRRSDILAKAAVFLAAFFLFGSATGEIRAATFTLKQELKKSAFMIGFVLLVYFSFCGVGASFGATFTVNSTADVQDASPGNGFCQTVTAGQCTLRAAITEANALAGDDIITLPVGTFTTTMSIPGEDANAGGDFDITSNITINGASPSSTIIQAATGSGLTNQRVLNFISGTSSVTRVTVRYGGTSATGSDAHGAGVKVNSSANVTLGTMFVRENRTVGSGGGIFIESFANVTLNSMTVRDNISSLNGGGIVSSGILTTNSAFITANSTAAVGLGGLGNGGGGIFICGTATLNNTTVSFNTAASNTDGAKIHGGGIWAICGNVNINNSSISDNSANVGGRFVSAAGGGLMVDGVDVTVTDSSVTNNAISSSSVVGGGGGGINFIGGSLTLNRTFVSGNTSAGDAAGIRNASRRQMNINQSAIINNTTTGVGGGIYNDNSVTVINNSTIAENKTNSFGGGLRNACDGVSCRIDINFSTVARNVADQDNSGGGFGGGISNSNSQSINLKSSIVADNTVGTGGVNPDISGVITSQGYNHVENVGTATFTTTTGDVTGTDPLLSALLLDGANSVFIPATNSPVIDTIPNGTNGCGAIPFDVDQRDAMRPTDSNGNAVAACEKGAVETPMAPTAAIVSVVGRIITAEGKGIARASVNLTDSNGQTLTTVSDLFGYYGFEAMAVGETYVFSVSSKDYLFTPQVINLNEDLSDLNFIAAPRKRRERQW